MVEEGNIELNSVLGCNTEVDLSEEPFSEELRLALEESEVPDGDCEEGAPTLEV